MEILKIKHISGYVAFLDILGFSELVQRDSFSREFEQYSEILKNALRKDKRDLQYVTFSDSVVINTIEANDEQLQQLIEAISEIIFKFMIDLDVPICGCVSRGQFWRHRSRYGDVMLAGPPIIDAYRFEQEQNWVGMILSPQILKLSPYLLEQSQISLPYDKKDARELENRFPWPLLLHRYSMIPFHKPNDFVDRNYDGFVIVPQHGGCQDPVALLDDLELYENKLDKLMSFAPEPNSQMKYKSTKIWIEKVREDWHRVTEAINWRTRHDV